MTKQEKKWIYGSILVVIILILFLLYLISDYSPLIANPKEAPLLDYQYEATSSSELNFN